MSGNLHTGAIPDADRESGVCMSDMAEYGKVAVLMGGRSAEREISLRSGAAVLQSLERLGIAAEGVDTAADNLAYALSGGGYSRAFVALHGRGGEDGVMQGFLEVLGIPYTGSRVLGSALAMDKLRTKAVWKSAGLPTPAFTVLQGMADVEAAYDMLEFPVMIKPVCEGSSIGMNRVDDSGSLQKAWRAALQYDREVLAEQWITGNEYTAAVLGDQVLPLIRLETPNIFYDYEAKYQSDSTRYICPCGLDQETEMKFQSMCLEAFRTVNASGWGRVDFLCDESGLPWLIEVNTVPGLTDHSLVPMAARAAGIDFDELVRRILDTSISLEAGGQ